MNVPNGALRIPTQAEREATGRAVVDQFLKHATVAIYAEKVDVNESVQDVRLIAERSFTAAKILVESMFPGVRFPDLQPADSAPDAPASSAS